MGTVLEGDVSTITRDQVLDFYESIGVPARPSDPHYPPPLPRAEGSEGGGGKGAGVGSHPEGGAQEAREAQGLSEAQTLRAVQLSLRRQPTRRRSEALRQALPSSESSD